MWYSSRYVNHIVITDLINFISNCLDAYAIKKYNNLIMYIMDMGCMFLTRYTIGASH